MSLIDSALWLASIGWPVFPVFEPVFGAHGSAGACACGNPKCNHIGKHPRTTRGFKDATCDEAAIRDWWTECPNANIGIATGETSSVVALDVDPRHGGDVTLAELEAEHGRLPHTVEALTGGGGRHLLFQHPGGKIKSREVAPGLDCKGDGGYLVAPPSLHRSGKRYAWELSSQPGETPLALIPPWLLALVRGPAPTLTEVGDAPVVAVREGRRNSALASLAGTMRRRGMAEPAIRAALLVENRLRCTPPLGEDEVAKIASSIGSYPPGSPNGGAARFVPATEAIAAWSESVYSGVPTALFKVGAGPLAEFPLGPGRVVVLGGQPGAGKTALCMQLTVEALRFDPQLRAVVCNVEMGQHVQLDRQLARLSGVDLTTIQRRKFDPRTLECLGRGVATLEAIANRLFFVLPPYSTENIISTAADTGSQLVVVDYLQRVRPPGSQSDRRGSVDAAMDCLRAFANEGGAVLAVAALSRTKDSQGRSTYAAQSLNLASFRESSELEYSADDAFILVNQEGDGSRVVLRHLKARHSEMRDIQLTFDRALQRFGGDAIPSTRKKMRRAAS